MRLELRELRLRDNVPLTEKETKGMFIDILPELPPDDGTAKVSFYLDDDADVEGILAQVKEGLEELKLFVDLGTVRSRPPRQRTRTGSITGSSILSLLPWTIS